MLMIKQSTIKKKLYIIYLFIIFLQIIEHK